MQELRTTCCIAGGGPAGMMLGFLLARAGVDVVVLEKHADFLRDFRGDTIHPSTLEMIHELGLLDEFLKLPHRRVERSAASSATRPIQIADFTHLPTRCKFIAMMPQWDFLDFLADNGRRYPHYHLRMRAEVTGLIEEGGRIVGVRATTPDGRAHRPRSAGRRRRRPQPRWCASAPASRSTTSARRWTCSGCGCRGGRATASGAFGRIAAGKMMVMLDRGDYWQCAYVIPKGAAEEIKAKGIEAFREAVVSVAPQMHDRVQELRSFDDVKLLTVKVDRLAQWHRPGLLCIGDAAHAMSPIGGVGVNLAVQDAVAAANRLAAPLAAGHHQRRRSRRRAAPPHVPDPDDASHPGVHAEQRAQRRAGRHAPPRCRHGRCGWSAVARCCSAFRRAWWGSACVPNMCWFHRPMCQQPRA